MIYFAVLSKHSIPRLQSTLQPSKKIGLFSHYMAICTISHACSTQKLSSRSANGNEKLYIRLKRSSLWVVFMSCHVIETESGLFSVWKRCSMEAVHGGVDCCFLRRCVWYAGVVCRSSVGYGAKLQDHFGSCIWVSSSRANAPCVADVVCWEKCMSLWCILSLWMEMVEGREKLKL